MSRWEPNARGRLEDAALELYTERGFDETTVAEIAERAGLTERTFFRHFADKREVLFGGQDALLELFVNAIVDGLWREYKIDHIDMPATPERVWIAINEHHRRHSL